MLKHGQAPDLVLPAQNGHVQEAELMFFSSWRSFCVLRSCATNRGASGSPQQVVESKENPDFLKVAFCAGSSSLAVFFCQELGTRQCGSQAVQKFVRQALDTRRWYSTPYGRNLCIRINSISPASYAATTTTTHFTHIDESAFFASSCYDSCEDGCAEPKDLMSPSPRLLLNPLRQHWKPCS